MTVRVVEWFAFFIPGVFLLACVYFVVTAPSVAERLKTAAGGVCLLLMGAGVYAGEVAFVKRIFMRLFRNQGAVA